MDSETPANKAMLYYFENNYAQQYQGRPRTTIVTTLNNDIQRNRNKLPNLPVITLKSLSDLQKLKELAQDRDAWEKFVNDINKVAEDEKSYSYQCAFESKQL